MDVTWSEGTGEQTGLDSSSYHAAFFGSSFNVTDQKATLQEIKRILVPRGWFACMWNHRQLDDPIQSKIEAIIKEQVSGYGYGTRREDQTPVIDASGLFGPVIHLDSRVMHEQTIEECVEAWCSHATLERQAGAAFEDVIGDIENYLRTLNAPSIEIPYSTNIWVAQLL